MKAVQSKWARWFFSKEGRSRKLLKQLRERDNLDGKPIVTDYGVFEKG